MEDHLFRQDVIAAVSTPLGRGAVGIIRLSGPGSVEFLRPLWRGRDLDRLPASRLTLGKLVDRNGAILDETLLVRMRAPRSYTGEEMVEIHCHGNPRLLKSILSELYALGVRPAEPGEFTFRAFRSGRMTLLEAEAVATLIDAKGEWARRNALNVLAEGGGEWVRDLMDDLLAIWIPVEADLEFPTDDLDSLSLETLCPSIRRLVDKTRGLLDRAVRFSKLQEGFRVVLAGEPNAGKSSLLNALLGYGRALVTDIPGTTRDTLEESFEIEGIPIRLIDTAGLGEARGYLDAQGMERSREAIRRADLIVLVEDASIHTPGESLSRIAESASIPLESITAPVLLAANKSDLLPNDSPWFGSEDAVLVSALQGTGLETLLERTSQMLVDAGGVDLDERTMLNDRQAETLKRAIESLERCLENIETGAPQDLIATDLHEAKLAFEDLSGKTLRIDLMGEIFNKFCIGK